MLKLVLIVSFLSLAAGGELGYGKWRSVPYMSHYDDPGTSHHGHGQGHGSGGHHHFYGQGGQQNHHHGGYGWGQAQQGWNQHLQPLAVGGKTSYIQ